MKRRFLTIAAFLLIGAIVNVAVAWSLSCLVRHLERELIAARRTTVVDGEGKTTEYLSVDKYRGVGALAYKVSLIRSPGIDKAFVDDAPEPEDVLPGWALPTRPFQVPPSVESGSDSESAVARGWPMLALTCHIDLPNQQRPVHQVRWAIDLRWIRESLFYPMLFLPLRPLWPGFAINTLFYAAVMWLLFAGPFALRRWRRLKRGVCPACAYPVGVSDVCTECGKPLPKRAGTAS